MLTNYKLAFAQHKKSRALAISIYVLLLQALCAVCISFWSSFESSNDAVAINLAGRQRMLSQRLAKCLLELDRIHAGQNEHRLIQQELEQTYELFDRTLASLSNNTVVDRSGKTLTLNTTQSRIAHNLISHAYALWTPMQQAMQPLLAHPGAYSAATLGNAISIVTRDNQQLLQIMDDLTNEIEDTAHKKSNQFEFVQTLSALLILVNFGFVLFYFRCQLTQLANSKSVLRRIMENVGTAIIVMDNAKNIESGNRSAEIMFGYGAGDLPGINLNDLVNGNDFPITGRRKNGELFSLEITLTEIPAMQRPLFIASLHDLTAQKIREEKLSHLAYHDLLTGLPNRLLFMDRLEQAIARAHRHHELFALLFIDLDRFKPVNDSMGHASGDLLLQLVATRLTGCLREGDTISRLGGDEFTMIIDANDADSCEIVAGKVLSELHREFDLNGVPIQISASIGLSLYPLDSSDIRSLLHCADVAMYRAKALGGNTICTYQDAHSAQEKLCTHS